MIGKLKGILDSWGDDWAIIDVGGVGYLVHCSSKTLAALPEKGAPVDMSIETYVREDMIKLFGFTSALEREWFLLLTTVQGVGTKVALAILSTLTPSELSSAVSVQDKAQVSRAPGVGPKVAQRIVSELKDKAPAFTSSEPSLAILEADIGAARAATNVTDAVSALVNLGYQQSQASAAVAAAIKQTGEEADAAQLIRVGLKELAA